MRNLTQMYRTQGEEAFLDDRVQGGSDSVGGQRRKTLLQREDGKRNGTKHEEDDGLPEVQEIDPLATDETFLREIAIIRASLQASGANGVIPPQLAYALGLPTAAGQATEALPDVLANVDASQRAVAAKLAKRGFPALAEVTE